MKRLNLMTNLVLCAIVILVSIFMVFSDVKDSSKKQSKNETLITEKKDDIKKDQKDSNIKSDKQAIKENTTKEENEKRIESFSMDNSLFIGDSRTVGLMEYSQMNEVDYFCTVGMSVFNIYDDSINVPHIGKVSLCDLLEKRKYDRIYLMLGVNEMGYKFEKIIEKYKELIQLIKEKEPYATIFLQANLHVTSVRSNSDNTFNNKSINRLNTALSKLANNKDIFYLDVNPLFDDENGNLSADKSSDNTHLYAKYYKDWGQWIIEQTALLTKGE